MVEGGVYSSFVRWMKIVLPVTALSLLAVLFLIARAPSGDGELPFADIEAIADGQQLLHPMVSGVTQGGDRVVVRADSIALEGRGGVAREFSMRVEGAGGGDITVRAGHARLADDGESVRVTDLARIDSSAGYRMETRDLTANLITGAVETDGALEVRAPFGQLSAGRLLVEPSQDDLPNRLVFQNGVRLLYQPQTP